MKSSPSFASCITWELGGGTHGMCWKKGEEDVLPVQAYPLEYPWLQGSLLVAKLLGRGQKGFLNVPSPWGGESAYLWDVGSRLLQTDA